MNALWKDSVTLQKRLRLDMLENPLFIIGPTQQSYPKRWEPRRTPLFCMKHAIE